MEAFPTIENILEQTNFSNFQKEIDELGEKERLKLHNDEYNLLNGFRIRLLEFYEKNRKLIEGEYKAEMEPLRKEIYEMLKNYKESIIQLRTKQLKIKEPEISLAPMPTPSKRRPNPGNSLDERYIKGDDFVREASRLPPKFQEKIKMELSKLNEIKDKEVQEIREKRNKERDNFWASITSRPRGHNQRLQELNMIDLGEKTDITRLLTTYQGKYIRTRQKYIELSKIPNVDLNSPESDAFEPGTNMKGTDVGMAENVGKVEKLEIKEIEIDNLYTQAIIQEKIKIQFSKFSNNMTRFFENYE
jgi:hypothetical protein